MDIKKCYTNKRGKMEKGREKKASDKYMYATHTFDFDNFHSHEGVKPTWNFCRL